MNENTAAVPSMKHNTRWLTLAGLLMAVNISLASFGVPIPGGQLYLCDISIVAASLILDPAGAFIACGIGAFLGDLFFYPASMFVSLFVHGFQAVIISVFARRLLRSRPKLSAFIGILLGAVFMVAGYTWGCAYIYGTPEYAWLGLPYEIVQALLGVIFGPLIVWKWKLGEAAERTIGR